VKKTKAWIKRRWELKIGRDSHLSKHIPTTDGFVRGNDFPLECYKIREAEIVVLTKDILEHLTDGRKALQVAVEMVQAEEVEGLDDADRYAIMFAAMNFLLKSSPKHIEAAMEGNDRATAVIEYLNKVTGKKFRPTPTHKNVIKARLKEGHTIEEMYCVIEWQTYSWQQDASMAKYLRPATLFQASKFDGYLQDVPNDIRQKHGLDPIEGVVNQSQDWE